MFGSNSIKVKSIKDWNEIIRKFTSVLNFFLDVLNLSNLLKVLSMIDDPKVRLLCNILSMKLPSSNTTTTF